MDHGERRSHDAALRAVQKPPAKPWRAAAAHLPAPPKVYRVEPREFRELVQRLTGAGPAAAKRARPPPPQLTVPVAEEGLPAPASQSYASWCAFPLLSPASMATLDGHHGHGALL